MTAVRPSSESLLTRRDGFGIETATPAQRAACRLIDGHPLRELAEHPDVEALVGGRDAIQALAGQRPTEIVYLASVRSAKTITACAAAISMAMTVDTRGLGPGEIPRVSIVSLSIDQSRVAFGILSATIQGSPLLRRLLVDQPTTESILLRTPRGRHIEIRTVASAKAGGSLVARWSAGVIFDEAPRMAGREDGAINLDDARSAILGRLLPGAKALYIGSPWAPFGTVYELTQQYWTKPSGGVLVLRGTGPMLNPQWWTPARCQALQERDPIAYQTDVLGEFADPVQGLLSPAAVYRATRSGPEVIPPHPGGRYMAACDPSGGGAGNAQTLVIVEVDTDDSQDPPESHYRVVLAEEWRGLGPDAYWREVASRLRPYRVDAPITDQFAASANADLASRYGLELDTRPWTAANKIEAFTSLATLIQTDRLELPPGRQFRDDLLSVRKKTTQSGYSIELPKTTDGRHADFAPALAAALKAAEHVARHGDPIIYTMTFSRYGGGRLNSHHVGSRPGSPYDPFTEHGKWWQHRLQTGILSD